MALCSIPAASFGPARLIGSLRPSPREPLSTRPQLAEDILAGRTRGRVVIDTSS